MIGSPEQNQLDISFGRFLASHSEVARDLLFKAGRAVSQARREGHVCVELQWVDPSMPLGELKTTLLATELVGGAGDYCPLILHHDFLYLHRYFNYETIVADFIGNGSVDQTKYAQVAELLEQLFPPTVDGVDEQKQAAISSLCNSFSVISGGPGTGKTTTVAKILALQVALNPDVRIMLAAPTGKAAMRLEESLTDTLEHLEMAQGYKDKITVPVKTIHRLLGFRPSGFKYNGGNQLPADFVLIDEASMVDLPLMADLMVALPEDCRLILLGDEYQLSSVQPGAVLGEICGGDADRKGQHADAIVTLRKSYRFKEDSGIRLLGDCIKKGNGKAALQVLQDDTYPDVSLKPHDISSLVTAAQKAYSGETDEDFLAGFAKLGVLCCHRMGDFGVEDINQQVMKSLGHKLHHYYHGLPLMILANDHGLGLYNGDTCVVVEQNKRFYACFKTAEGRRLILIRKLPVHAPAYGITVHKSQGSEYGQVAFVLPKGSSKVLGRELVYTAVTRAKREVTIYGAPEQILDAVGRRVVRVSGLGERLRGR